MLTENQDQLKGIEITGVILATDFDRHGQILEIALETDDFQKYIIHPDVKGKSLIENVLNRVVIRGVISGRNEEGNSILQVRNFEILEEYEDLY